MGWGCEGRMFLSETDTGRETRRHRERHGGPWGKTDREKEAERQRGESWYSLCLKVESDRGVV